MGSKCKDGQARQYLYDAIKRVNDNLLTKEWITFRQDRLLIKGPQDLWKYSLVEVLIKSNRKWGIARAYLDDDCNVQLHSSCGGKGWHCPNPEEKVLAIIITSHKRAKQ